MVVILLVGMIGLNNFVSAETLEDVKPSPVEETVNSPEPSSSSEEASESPSPSVSAQAPADSPKASEQQEAVFSSYDKNKAQVLGTLTKQSYADNTLVAQATVSVVGGAGVTSVYSGLRAEISDGQNTLKTLDLKDLGIGDIHNFTVKISNLLPDQYDAYASALQLKVYFKDECIAVAAFDKGTPAVMAGPLSETGVSPLRLIVTPNANDTVTGGVIEKLTGNSAVVSVTTSASAMEGAVVLIPVKNNAYSDVKFAALSSPDVKTGVLNNYTFTYEGKTVSGDFIVAVIPNAGAGSFLASMSVEYTFKNGITPAGATQSITGYALQGQKVSGEGLFGSGIAVLADGASDKGATYTYKAKLDEDITVEKSIVSVTDTDVMFADLKERSYRDVVAPSGTTDDYYVNYKIALKTSGNGKFEGRLYNSSIKITDTLSGFLATGVPKSITVKTAGGQTVAVYDEQTVGTTHVFSFDVPVVNTESLSNQEYIVTVKYSKNDYTNRHNGAPVLSAPQVISNSADATVTPVAGNAYDVEGNTVENAFGYVQEAPLTPSLSIKKNIVVSGQTYTYDAAMQSIYGAENAPVTFKLTPVGGGQAQTVTIGTDGKAKFENLAPGTTYTLSETVAVSSLFDKVADMTVVVSPLDNNGLATVKVESVDYTSKELVINNTGSYIGSIRAQATKQNLHEYPAKYSNYVGCKYFYMMKLIFLHLLLRQQPMHKAM